MTTNTLRGIAPPPGLRRFAFDRVWCDGYKKKATPMGWPFLVDGAPGTIRTCDRLVRSHNCGLIAPYKSIT